MVNFYLKVFATLTKQEQQETLNSFLEKDNIILDNFKSQVKALELLLTPA